MKKITLEQYQELADEYGGICISCGTEAYNIEPDARKYVCDYCGAKKVYGAEELLIMGLVI